MLNVRLTGGHLYEKLAVAGGVLKAPVCWPFSHEVSWMRSGTLFSQFLRVFLPTLLYFTTFSVCLRV